MGENGLDNDDDENRQEKKINKELNLPIESTRASCVLEIYLLSTG